jgi:hypothetical protein
MRVDGSEDMSVTFPGRSLSLETIDECKSWQCVASVRLL